MALPPDAVTVAAAVRKGARSFALVAEALRKELEPAGFRVHVSTEARRITLTEVGYLGGGESSIHVHVKEIPE